MANYATKILSINKKSFIFLIISILINITIFGYLFFLLNSINYTDKEGVVLGDFKKVSEIDFTKNSSINIEQEILSRLDNLGKITLTVNSKSTTTLTLKLVDKQTNETIRQTSIQTEFPENSIELLEWIFEPINNSENIDYLLQINSIINSEFIFYSVEPDRYDGGPLYVNNIIDNNNRIVIDWEYYTPNPINKIFYHLTFFKPGIFNYVITYIIMLVFMFILQTLIIWYVLKVFFKKTD